MYYIHFLLNYVIILYNKHEKEDIKFQFIIIIHLQ